MEIKLKNIVGFHITNKYALDKIKKEGFKGYRIAEAKIEKSFTPLIKGKLHKDGWVFAYPSIEDAEYWIEAFGPEPSILQVEGLGFKFFHVNDSEDQIALRADTIKKWKVIK